jgi:hypothetical protein
MVYVGGTMQWQRHAWIEFKNLEPGQYQLYSEVDGTDNKFCVCAYSAMSVHFLTEE